MTGAYIIDGRKFEIVMTDETLLNKIPFRIFVAHDPKRGAASLAFGCEVHCGVDVTGADRWLPWHAADEFLGTDTIFTEVFATVIQRLCLRGGLLPDWVEKLGQPEWLNDVLSDG